MNGLAGTGKSTIARTIAERLFADGRLGASFFCSRDFEDRSNLQFVFPTLAVQLARNYPEFRSIFVPLVESDPGIAHESLHNQMNKLITKPLRKPAISTVIVIDALDECKDEEPASAILSVLGRFVSEVPKIKFFLTGRPEPRIQTGFRLPLLVGATDVFVLHDVEPDLVNNDIRLFLKQSFMELTRRRRGLDGWPTNEQLDRLCERAAGLFVYAVATVKFVDHRNKSPKKQLERLLKSPESSTREGKTEFKPRTTLDSLYTSILQEAFDSDDPEDDPKIRSVLGAVILTANPLSPLTIATLLGFDVEEVFPLLSSMHSLLILQEDINYPVRPFHKSFPDFITDPTRCTNQRFHISPPDHHLDLLIHCLKLMDHTMEKNMCKLPEAVINSEVDDLQERREQYINHALQYACKSWHKHLVDKHLAHTPEITSALHHFLEKKFLFWLEVLSVFDVARNAVDALEVATKWLVVSWVSVLNALPKFTNSNQESPTLDLTNDCFRFVTGFFEVISTSAPHIYHSALLLSPKTSIVQKLHGSLAHPLARVVQGAPTSWNPSIANIRFPNNIYTATWSPCSKFIAIAMEFSSEVAILDAVTLEQLHTLHPAKEITWRILMFSPDGHLLTGHSNTYGDIVSWDLQTGGLISNISTRGWCSSMSYSGCGTMLGCLFDRDTITTYNTISGIHISSHSITKSVTGTIWTHGECLQFATVESGSITIWEVGFTSGHAPTEIGSLPTPDNFSPNRLVLLPTLSRLAFIIQGRVLVWDAQHQKTLLDSEDVEDPVDLSFSPDGCLFICRTQHPVFHIWKESPDGYLPHQKVMSSTSDTNPVVSPNGESIISFGDSVLQLFYTTSSPTSPPSISTQTPQRTKNFLLEFSPDESLVAFTQWSGRTVTVLDVKSGNPLLVIDTGIEVYGIRMTGSSIVVVGDGMVVTWDLPAGDSVPNNRADITNSVQTTTFEYSADTGKPCTSISPDLNHIAIIAPIQTENLFIYDMHTGELLVATTSGGYQPWFTPDGHKVWCAATSGKVHQWAIIKDGRSNVIRLEFLEAEEPSSGFPWHSSCGYQVMDNGWILNSSGKYLLWLPHQWRPVYKIDLRWSRNFLAMLQDGLPEPVILELEV